MGVVESCMEGLPLFLCAVLFSARPEMSMVVQAQAQAGDGGMMAEVDAAAASGGLDVLDSSLAPPPSLSSTEKIREIAVDYCPEVCEHKAGGEIVITFDERGGARWRSVKRFEGGAFSAMIKCPDGNTSGLNCSFYLSSLEGDKNQDEIDFEFLGKDKGIVQTNYYTTGTGNREVIHQLGFDASQDFHEYTIRWSPSCIEWSIDGKEIRVAEKIEGESFPSKSMFLYASVWNAGYIDEGKWAGAYIGCDTPYVCRYKDVHVPSN